MLKIKHKGNSVPFSYPLSPSGEFQAGQLAQLTSIGNNVMATVSDGSAPFALIDDTRTQAFSNNVLDEQIIVRIPPAGTINASGVLKSAYDIKVELKYAGIYRQTFRARQVLPGQVKTGMPLILNDVNGVVTVSAGSVLNYDENKDGILDSIRFFCDYTYIIPNYMGEDTTAGTGKVTLWLGPLLIETNMCEANVSYPINAPLYVSPAGKFTTTKAKENYPAVGMVMSRPNKLGWISIFYH